MLFNSYIFIFAFLPFTLLLFHGLRRAGFERSSIFSLTVMSLVFYGWWNIKYLLLIVPLMFVNFAIATRIIPRGGHRPPFAKTMLTLGLTVNLGALGYFKYANFFIDNFNNLFGLSLFLSKVVLPLGISFYIFQKIAFLVDAYRGKVERLDLLEYSLFVTFFPQLIAGPIVHHSEVMPQFRTHGRVKADFFALGMTIFAIGLAKKVLLADTAALYASPQFAMVAAGGRLDFLSAWSAALAYTAQLYFDFSGYSDMAIGGALLFGIRLPINFASPYKSANIIEFWRRWHLTLSRFLKDYLYIPLGGNRKGRIRRYVNLLITMFLGGLWHGAGWTFVLWGTLHGFYLVINHAWLALKEKLGMGARPLSGSTRLVGQVITFFAVAIAWVFFRSETLGSAVQMLRAMMGGNGIASPASLTNLLPGLPKSQSPVDSGTALLVSFVLLMIAWFAPNTQQLTAYSGPKGAYGTNDAGEARIPFYWTTSPRWAVAIGSLLAITMMSMSKVSEFIYFQF
jgi:alginate O-acetyltransferase complex protein AlgI